MWNHSFEGEEKFGPDPVSEGKRKTKDETLKWLFPCDLLVWRLQQEKNKLQLVCFLTLWERVWAQFVSDTFSHHEADVPERQRAGERGAKSFSLSRRVMEGFSRSSVIRPDFIEWTWFSSNWTFSWKLCVFWQKLSLSTRRTIEEEFPPESEPDFSSPSPDASNCSTDWLKFVNEEYKHMNICIYISIHTLCCWTLIKN